jgi:phage terminase small subunit
MTDHDLSLKQQLFIEAYLGEAKGNATEAARRAGYSGSEDTLRQVASENLTKPAIAARIAQRVREVAMSADEVLIELTKIARAPWQEFVVEVTNGRGQVVDVRLSLTDKLKALELLAKYHKLLVQQVDVSAPLTKLIMGVDLDKIV